MAILLSEHHSHLLSKAEVSPSLASREQSRRKQIVSIVLLIIILFQLIDLPGALMSHSVTAIGIAVLGLALCGLAMLFNHFGRVTVVSVLLILVVDLGCGLMLLTSPMGLDVGDLPVFDVLLVSELIAVSLLPALSVFPVAFTNVLFILLDIAFQPHTPAFNMVLTSDMGYGAVAQPVALQIVVALITYFWVRSALRAIARADYVEEVAQLQQREAELLRREAERTRQLDLGSQHLLEVLVRAANGEHTVRAALPADNLLWRVSSALNILLIRLRRALQAEKEYQRLRIENARLTKLLFGARNTPQHPAQNAPHGAKPL
jgi:hypothetical protein